MLTAGFKVKTALFLVDREHVSSFEVISEEVKKYGFTVEDFKEIVKEKAAIFRLRRGHLTVERFYTVIAGKERKIEEELMELAQKFGLKVKPEEARRRLKNSFVKLH